MPLPPWREEPIARRHRRDRFDCGVPELNDYLAHHARNNHDRGYTRTFVLVPEDEPERVLGYYSLANASIEFDDVRRDLLKGLPAYPVPAVRLARLARDLSCRGEGLGSQLLLCAGERALTASEHSGAVMLLIDAKDERAANWYRQHDGVPLVDSQLHLVIPLKSIEITIAERVRASRP